MSEPIPFQPDRFRTAAAHYLQGRSPYAAGLIRRVVQLTGLTREDRVMDLGCGPGQLARAFAAHAREIVAVDPEPEMLAIARKQAAQNIRFVEGSSYTIGPDLGQFRLVTIGRAFHWMDRAATLKTLDTMIVPGGAVALFHDWHVKVPENDWHERFEETIRAFLGEEHKPTWRHPGWLRHEAMLLPSPFSHLERIGVIERHRITLDTLVDRILSRSTTSRAKLGPRADDLIARARAVMGEFGENFTEVIESEALIAWRPAITHPSTSSG